MKNFLNYIKNKENLNEIEGKALDPSDRNRITHITKFPPELYAGLKKIIPGGKFVPDENMRRNGTSIFGLTITLPGWNKEKFMVQWDEMIDKTPDKAIAGVLKGLRLTQTNHVMTLWTDKKADADDSTTKGQQDWFPTKEYEGETESEPSKRIIQYLKSKVKRMIK